MTRTLLTITLVSVAAIAHAAPPAFTSLDRNFDGQITQSELRHFADRKAKDADLDDSGDLTPNELARMMPGSSVDQAERYINMIDQNADGALSLDEAAVDIPRIIRLADTNGDGTVSRGEYHSALEKFKP